jgi:hypothetical protein
MRTHASPATGCRVASWWQDAVILWAAEGQRDTVRRQGPPRIERMLNAWNDLLWAERIRETIITLPDKKWSENFATSKEEMLRSVGTRIRGLREKLGLAAKNGGASN